MGRARGGGSLTRLAVIFALAVVLVPAARAGVTVSAHVGPNAPLFADTLTARVHVKGKATGLDVDFAPYVQSREPHVHRSGDETTYTYAISCVAFACLPKKNVGYVLRLKPLHVLDGRRVIATAPWNVVTVRSRLAAADVPRANPFVTDATPLSMPKFRDRIVLGRAFAHDPHRTRLALWLAALLAIGGALALLLPDVRAAFHVVVPRPSALRRAIGWTREAAAAGDARARRRALQALAEALAAVGAGAIAGRAGEAAWRRPEPTPGTATSLADEAEPLDRRRA